MARRRRTQAARVARARAGARVARFEVRERESEVRETRGLEDFRSLWRVRRSSRYFRLVHARLTRRWA